ncbi:MAG: GPR endopeptidase [Lachnospiraceae bacterium]|nr:GPR endopeptidase [Lachnospiraceae bacterium]
MNSSKIRTDLALEAHENIENAELKTRGIKVDEIFHEQTHTKITKLHVTTRNGSHTNGKPIGTYITLETPNLVEEDEDYHREISMELAEQLEEIIPDFKKEQSILVVGLGNRDVTADALGPNVIDNLFITRHIINTYGKAAYNKTKMHAVSSLVPGVMAKNGMETSEIVKGVIDQTHPNVMIVIDALAARSIRRLNRTIQITNTGIHPGSGVGNHRNGLTKDTLGIPVIAIGIPTVVDAATIVKDAASQMGHDFQPSPLSQEQENLLYELHNMYVTSKDVDAVIKRLSYMVSEALNIAFSCF